VARASERLGGTILLRIGGVAACYAACAMSVPSRQREASGAAATDVFSVIFDAVPAFIWFKDTENRILRINRPAADAVGLPPEVIEGRPTSDFYPAAEAERYYQDDLEVIRSGQPKLGFVEPLTSGSGERRWVRTDKLPYRAADGRVIGVIVFAVDITERVQAEEALRQARDGLERRVAERTAELADVVADLRGEIGERHRAEERLREQQAQIAHLQRLRTVESLAAQLAHEINQPLGAIVNFANGLVLRLRNGAGDAAALLTAGEEISQQALRAAEVVRRLREFVRKTEQPRVACHLPPVVQDAGRLLDSDLRRRGVSLHVEAPDELPLVDIDRTQIEQVVVNLLANAIDAIDGSARREIRVALRAADGGGVAVRVEDSGPGLRPDERERLFEPFFTTKADGLGMGLPISRSIVDAHGGRLWAEPAASGGAAFVFVLPAAA
jgi:PAS domain S-box-containing protein